MDNPFTRSKDTEIIANICSFERMGAAISEFQPFKATGPNGLYHVLLQEDWNQLKKILPRHFSSMPKTQLCTIGMGQKAQVYFSPKLGKESYFEAKSFHYDHFNFFPTEMVGKTNSALY